MEQNDEKDDKKDNDVISSYFKDIKQIMDLHGRMVSAVDDTVNRLPFGQSLNYSLAATIAANSTKIGKKHKKKISQKKQKNQEKKDGDEIAILIQKKDQIMEKMNQQIATLQKMKDLNERENILTQLNNKLSLIDDTNEEILKLQNIKNNNDTDEEFNDENDISFDGMDIAQEHAKLVKTEEKEKDPRYTFHFVGFGSNNLNNYESIRIMEKVSGITIRTNLKHDSSIGQLRQLICDTFNIPLINNKRDKNDLLILYSHLVLNDDFLDEQSLSDVGIIDNSFFLIAIKDKQEEDSNIESIFDITEDDIEVINQMFNIKQKNEETKDELDIGQILQRLKIEKKLSLDIITQESDVEVFKMPNCGHSMTASSLYDYALSQCLNKQKMLTCAHFKCAAEWKYPIIKQYLLTNIMDDIIASVMLQKEREEKQKEDVLKDAWHVGAFCLIFSRSKDKWLTGNIAEIIGQDNDEWLIIKYGHNFKNKKKIQRYCKDIKPIEMDHPSNFIKGSKCKIFDCDSKEQWFDGEVVDIFNDNEGEWLKVKYVDNKIFKVCDIQRYSKDIKLMVSKSDQEQEIKKNKKYDINYISKIKCGKLEILLARNILFRNQKYSVQKCINCNVLLYRMKTSQLNKIKFGTKCRMCAQEFCWSCNKEWTTSHSCDASFRFQVIEILSTCAVKEIGSQQSVPSVRSCPSCSALIYHVEACKHMDCGECHQSFCFVCLQSKDENDEWQCGGYSEHCPNGVHSRQTNKDLPPMTYTKKFQLF